MTTHWPLDKLRAAIDGEVLDDHRTRALYATDASPYQVMPAAVVRPRDAADCAALVSFAAAQQVPLIPRAAGTSLAGQCVGSGVVVDMSRHMHKILDIDIAAGEARVQPGVVAAALNARVAAHGLRFAPDPSTLDRCQLAGMAGNNAWGVHAPRDGATRDHIVAMSVLLSNGQQVTANRLDTATLDTLLTRPGLEGDIYRALYDAIEHNQPLIETRYPAGVPNNSGYALDVLRNSQPWNHTGAPFNLATLLCGSEGTLALATELTVRLSPIPAHRVLLCAQFNAMDDAMQAVTTVMAHQPAACELLDRHLVSLARTSPAQQHQLFWLHGEPAAVLLIEFSGEDPGKLATQCQTLTTHLQDSTRIQSLTPVSGADIDRVWSVRRAGLGLLMGSTGDRKPVTGMEDMAVPVAQLAAWHAGVAAVMAHHDLACVVYGSVSLGLVQYRPLLNLHAAGDRALYAELVSELAQLCARHGGSISAKHGDGRLRASLLRQHMGDEVVALWQTIKHCFDPQGIFNPGKIVDSPVITADLRAGAPAAPALPVIFDWSGRQGMAKAAAQCNGAGVCLRAAGSGTQCPSYQATGDEAYGTRGRANLLRQALGKQNTGMAADDAELLDTLEQCLGCKGCKRECPAGVDIDRLKSEWLWQYHQRHGIPWRRRLIAHFANLSRLASPLAPLANSLLGTTIMKRVLGIHPQRSLPRLAPQRFSQWWQKHTPAPSAHKPVALLLDPFTEYYEPQVGIAAVELLEHLDYRVTVTDCIASGRVEISQGLLPHARNVATRALQQLAPLLSTGIPLIGLEPSETLTWRDEVPALIDNAHAETARLAAGTLLLQEFLLQELDSGALAPTVFDNQGQAIVVHVHCHEKALVGSTCLRRLLGYAGDDLNMLTSGCCGMAGAFGYAREHYPLSIKINDLILGPAIAATPAESIIVASGASCRQQIRHTTGRNALHPAQLLHMHSV